MKKINILWIIIDMIFLIIFNVFFFVPGGNRNNASVSILISYGFIHFAYFMLLLTPFLIRKGKSSAAFGFSLYSISAGYFLIELVTGIVFIVIFPESCAAALLVQVCIAGLYGITLVSNMIANEHTAKGEKKQQNQIAYIKDAASRLKFLMDRVSDNEVKKKVERLYDAVYSSPVKSHPNLAQTEIRVLRSIDELESEISAGNKEKIISLAESLLAMVNERNIRVKTLN
jgi:hypothetical protein